MTSPVCISPDCGATLEPEGRYLPAYTYRCPKCRRVYVNRGYDSKAPKIEVVIADYTNPIGDIYATGVAISNGEDPRECEWLRQTSHEAHGEPDDR